MTSKPHTDIIPYIGEASATQPCSGVKTVEVRVFGPGVGAATPEFVCVWRKTAA